MLKPSDNEKLVRVGPGQPAGELLRRYWMPALLASELPEADGAPVRLRLLGEDLIAFRDTQGQIGILDAHCPHRRAPMFFGRNEDCGLRCVYHGWKFDVNGQCVDVPSEPAESGYAKKIKLKSYPLIEKGGVLWTYMGPTEQTPPEPEWEFATVPLNQSFTSKRLQECNWLQAMEGGMDSSHVSFLHSGEINTDPLFKGSKGNQYNINDRRPVFEVVESDGGLFIGARRNAENGQYYWRITQYVMPSFTMIAPRGGFFRRDNQWDVENVGQAPDIDVENWPKDMAAGHDAQLERAVAEGLKQLAAKPVQRATKEPPPPLWGKRIKPPME